MMGDNEEVQPQPLRRHRTASTASTVSASSTVSTVSAVSNIESNLESQSSTSTLVDSPLDVENIPQVLLYLPLPLPLPSSSSPPNQANPAQLPTNNVEIESPCTTTTTEPRSRSHPHPHPHPHPPASPSFLGSFFSTLASIGWSTSSTNSSSSPASIARSRQSASILSPSQALPGAFPVSPAPLIEQSLGLETQAVDDGDEDEDEQPRMYPDFHSIDALLLPPEVHSTRAAIEGLTLPVIRPTDIAPELSGDEEDLDSSYVNVKVPDPSFPQSPGHRFPPPRFRTVERSPLTWSEIPATLPANSNRPEFASTQNAHAGPSRASPQERHAATSVAALPTQAAIVYTDPEPPQSAVISLADAVPWLRREDSDIHSPRNTGSPASHSSGSSTVIPARKPRPPQSIVRLPEPASPPPPLTMARESPSRTQPALPRPSPSVPGAPPIQPASFTRSPPRQLRSPRAVAIWAAIVDLPPEPPLFVHSDLKPTPAPAPPQPVAMSSNNLSFSDLCEPIALLLFAWLEVVRFLLPLSVLVLIVFFLWSLLYCG